MSEPRRDIARAVSAQLAERAVSAQLARRSAPVVWFFSRIFERSLRQTFHAVRVANPPPNAVLRAPALVVYSNHASWWDAAIFLLVANRVLGGRPAFAPMDAAMARRYGFFSRIGVFGVEREQWGGARRFLGACRSIFANESNVLLLTAQGRFSDCRERPIDLQPGVAHLANLAPVVTYLPLAVEYTFWLEKRPELLLRFGKPLQSTDYPGQSNAARLTMLEAGLTDTMNDLTRDAIARNAAGFRVLLAGRRGINLPYDLWRRASAAVKGRSYEAEHGPHP